MNTQSVHESFVELQVHKFAKMLVDKIISIKFEKLNCYHTSDLDKSDWDVLTRMVESWIDLDIKEGAIW